MLLRFEAEKQTASARIVELMDKVNADENATISIQGEIAQGTLIEICNVALYVVEPLRKVSIRLDRAAERLVIENI